MDCVTDPAINSARHPVVAIIGGGFAGITLAHYLEKTLPAAWRIVLLSRDNYITYNPLLAEVVGASILPGHVVAPLRQMVRRTQFQMAEVSDVDLERREIITADPWPRRIGYDHLVFACGVQARMDMVPGMAEHAVPFKRLGDALELRNRVLMQLERAELAGDDETRRALTRFIIIGGGFSGVELAGEIHDFLCAAQQYYPCVRAADCNVTLLHGRERLLNEISPTLGDYAQRKMTAAGIDVRVKTRVTQVVAGGVEIDGAAIIEGATIISTIGTTPLDFVRRLPVATERGAIVTEPDMSLPGHDNVWAIGDCASILNGHDGGRAPPTAQFAIHEARQLAPNMARRIDGRPTRPFAYRSRGQMASIGHNKAVAVVYGLHVSGFIAWLLWRGYYLLQIPTLARKVRIFFEWNWEMIFPPDIAHLRFNDSRRRPEEKFTGDRRQATGEPDTPRQSDSRKRHTDVPRPAAR